MSRHAHHVAELVRQAVDDLSRVDAASPEAAIAPLSSARERIGAALDEAMALAVAEGSSVRQVASLAGIAPNSAPPRLARSSTLGGYARAGRVDATGIARARHDRTTGGSGTDEGASGPHTPPPRFTRRTSKES